MSILDQLKEDMKSAMRAKEQMRLTVIRSLMADLKNREIDKRAPLEDSEAMDAVASMVKKRKDAIAEAEAAGRSDVADREREELAFIEAYLPAQMSQDEIEKLVDEAIAESGAQGAGDMGKVMRILVPQTKGRADGKLVNDVVRSKLTA